MCPKYTFKYYGIVLMLLVTLHFVKSGFTDVFKGPFSECCSEYWEWIKFDESGLRQALKEKLYGQHLVADSVLKLVSDHSNNRRPKKALALSFHGPAGTGKNYVSGMVAEHLYAKGMQSKYVHIISAVKEFPHYETPEIAIKYKDKLRNIVERAVQECARSMFIFDEMDKMGPLLIDTIKPYLDYYDKLDGIDYRKSVFIFLSNAAGADINRYTHQHWQKGLQRELIKLEMMEDVIEMSALNLKGSGFRRSTLITYKLISAYIPFLPLERRHVKECIKDAIVEKGYARNRWHIADSIVQDIADTLMYQVTDGMEVFSTTGCKRINDKVALHYHG